ncbi:MAG: GNAT family N-acetyltransferase [Lachnospira sp.]|nr:GNAT family N-acetyltransferase [Lachnospira sp.]
MNMIEIRENVLTVDLYLKLRAEVNWKVLSRRQARMAIENSLYSVVAYYNGEPVGMGRLVGDGAVITYVQDLVVIPSVQKKGVGGAVLKALKDYTIGMKEEGTEMMLCLMCAKGREGFYEKYGFIARPTENLGPGMIQYL